MIVINGIEIWAFSQHEAITIALTKSIKKRFVSARKKKKNVMRKSALGAGRLTAFLIYHRCAFLGQQANMILAFGKNFVLSCDHCRAHSNGRKMTHTQAAYACGQTHLHYTFFLLLFFFSSHHIPTRGTHILWSDTVGWKESINK